MTSLFLTTIGPQIIGFDKAQVVGVGASENSSQYSGQNENRRFLRLPDDERAHIFDLLEFFGLAQGNLWEKKRKCYLVLQYNGQFLAIPILGRGQWVSVIASETMTLPPAFSSRSRQFIPQVFLNGNDIVLLPDVESLFLTTISEVSE